MSPSDSLLDGLLADLAAEGDLLWNAVAGLDDAGLARADPGRRLGRRHLGRPPALDRRGRHRRRDRQGRLGRRRDWRPSRTRTASSTPPPTRSPGSRPPALLARWGAARTALAEALRGLPGGHEDAVVRPADVGGLDGDRAVHGDLGARARRVRRPGPRGRAHRPGPPRGPPRGADPRLRLLRARARAAGRGVPRRAGRALRGDLDLGPARRRAVGARLGVRLLPAGHPAPAPRRHRPGRRPAPTPSAGSASRRPSPARPDPDGRSLGG